MTKSRYGMLAGVAGAAFAAAWWFRRRGGAGSGIEPGAEFFDGDVIYSNTPQVGAAAD